MDYDVTEFSLITKVIQLSLGMIGNIVAKRLQNDVNSLYIQLHNK